MFYLFMFQLLLLLLLYGVDKLDFDLMQQFQNLKNMVYLLFILEVFNIILDGLFCILKYCLI